MAPLDFTNRRRQAKTATAAEAALTLTPPAGLQVDRNGLPVWARPDDQIEQTRGILAVQIQEITGKGDRPASALSPTERYTLGAYLAARWCAGQQPNTPLAGEPTPATVGRVLAEIALAEYLILSEASNWDTAMGVRAWLRWLTGQDERMVFRAL